MEQLFRRRTFWEWLRGFDPSRDLSLAFRGRMTVTLNGKTLELRGNGRTPLVMFVTEWQAVVTGEVQFVANTKQTPWRATSWDSHCKVLQLADA